MSTDTAVATMPRANIVSNSRSVYYLLIISLCIYSSCQVNLTTNWSGRSPAAAEFWWKSEPAIQSRTRLIAIVCLSKHRHIQQMQGVMNHSTDEQHIGGMCKSSCNWNRRCARTELKSSSTANLTHNEHIEHFCSVHTFLFSYTFCIRLHTFLFGTHFFIIPG